MSSLFINSGALGHGALFEIFQEVTAHLPQLDAHHVHIGKSITLGDRIIRKLMSARLPGPAGSPGSNTDFIRLRAEFNVGMMARRHIRNFEKKHFLSLLHFHPQPTAYCSLERMRRKPSIVSVDSTQQLMSVDAPTDFQKWTYKPSIAWDRKVFRAAGAIISTSAWAARDLTRNYPESAAKVAVMPYPVLFRWFPETWLTERAARDGACPVFLFMGNDFERKGGLTLLEAWRDFRPLNAVLRIATGSKTPLPEMPPGVEVIRGTQPHTPGWQNLWKGADVFVLPTHSDAFGIVFQEAAAAGLPSIGTQLNAIPEIVLDGETGLLVPPRDAPALGRALAQLAESRELRLRLGSKARLHVSLNSSTEVYADKLMRVIDKIGFTERSVA